MKIVQNFSRISVLLQYAAGAYAHLGNHHHHDHEHYDRDLAETTRTCGYEAPSDAEREEIDRVVERAKANKMTDDPDTIIHIDTYFHLMIDEDGTGDVANETVFKQMIVLNEAFNGTQNSQYSECEVVTYNETEHTQTNFKFELKDIFRWRDDDWFDMGDFESRNKREEARMGNCSTLNIFSGQLRSGLLGIATRPTVCTRSNGILNAGDNVQILHTTLPGGAMNNFNQGDTLVHEVGHWMGLDHTFQGGCFGVGDSVDDTPRQQSGSGQCPINRDSCRSDPGLDPIHNFMDYSDDCCMYQFTPGQTDRMKTLVAEFRDLKILVPTVSPTASPTLSNRPTVAPSSGPTEIREPLEILASGLVQFFNFPPIIIVWAGDFVFFLESTIGPLITSLLDRFV